MNDTMKKVAIARKIARPNTKEFIGEIFEDFLEFMVTGFMQMTGLL